MEKIQKMNDVCKEVISILVFFNNDIIEKIPSRILILINELAADSKQNYYIDKEKGLLDQNISEESKDLLALLYYSYIADENEKTELLKIWDENEKKYQKELNEKYNIDNIFKKSNKEISVNIEETENNTSLIEYKENFFTRFKKFLSQKLHINR